METPAINISFESIPGTSRDLQNSGILRTIESEYNSPDVRTVELELPQSNLEELGFKLTRTQWDPYPWIREITAHGIADKCGLKSGDCVIKANDTDLLGLPMSSVAQLVKGNDGSETRAATVRLLLWNCGVSTQDDPESLWSGGRCTRAHAAVSGVLRALSCSVCAGTAPARAPSAQCARGHLSCARCRERLTRCPLCRDVLPNKDSVQARNLVADQVFDAIAEAYELQDETSRLRLSNPKKPSPQSTCSGHCQTSNQNRTSNQNKSFKNSLSKFPHHRLVARLRPASSLVDLSNGCSGGDSNLSKSMTNLDSERGCQTPICCCVARSLEQMASVSSHSLGNSCAGGSKQYLDTVAPLYVLTPAFLLQCDHD